MRKKIIAGNWKMNMGPKEADSFLSQFLTLVDPNAHQDWVLFPPYVTLPSVASKLKNNFIKLGAQNCHFESKGAFTGEISLNMLKEVGCHYVLVGHSERRQLFGETDLTCAQKIKSIEEASLIPMLCVGETQSERDEKKTNEVLKKQVVEGLKHWTKSSTLTLAYEPVWAIGTGKVATPPMVEEAHAVIRRLLSELSSPSLAGEIRILYGGSVKPDNKAELALLPNVDGFLVGGASLEPKSFAQIGQLPL